MTVRELDDGFEVFDTGPGLSQELQEKLSRMGLHVDSSHFYTSALATANFIATQTPNAKVFVIGEPGLYNALYEKGIILDDTSPDYVVIGESYSYNYENICRAVRHIQNGARLIGTNSDLTGPTEQGIIPACRAFVKPIEMVTGKEAYYIGKPNPLMMRTGLNMLGVHSKEAAIIGDRMDTDIVSGIESGLDTVLVLSGVSTMETVKTFPYRPRLILKGVGEIPTLAKEEKAEKTK